ncbi:hypothetical protein QBC37DRAFT_424728 [Rhypophila decipiens]|uniref:Xylanolytic transcriptional activator regulatory domain-containing protein n=1 Tax=Rhypophila decipiens TaxID=261697 RepID=A0AAN6Y752_9PEZI|nr:hypothetical protein QBC37DRAFT_424728 [Rhypophila decipiens]
MLGASRRVLSRKYRFGVEQCLAKADFLNVPNLVLIQALATFLLVLRRDESPRYVWMMTGLVIRMAMALGLHRDGAKLKHLSPYEIEIRRRVWYVVLGLDLRSSEDQGVDLTIPHGSFDTQVPLNINDLDLDPHSTEQPAPREGFTDMTFALYSVNTCRWTRDTFGPNRGLVDVEKRLNDFYITTNENFLKVTIDLPDMSHRIGYMVLRLVIAKMTLILYMPELFSTPADKLPPDFRTKLFMSALEVAEINYALNAEPKARHWRWMVQTYTQWHAIVILLIEISRRPWSHTVERAWSALQSKWLIPNQESMNRSLRVWIPLRKLIAQAKRHRNVEIERLRHDAEAARRLEEEDERTLVPPRGGGLYEASVGALHKEKWRILVGTADNGPQGEGVVQVPHIVPGLKFGQSEPLTAPPSLSAVVKAPASLPEYTGGGQPVLPQTTPSDMSPFQSLPGVHSVDPMTMVPPAPVPNQEQQNVYTGPTTTGATTDFEPWLWADLPANPNSTDNMFDGINLDGIGLTGMEMEDMYSRVDWMDWLGTAQDVERGKIPDGLDDGAWGMGGGL